MSAEKRADAATLVIVDEVWQTGIAAGLFPAAVVVKSGGNLAGLRIGIVVDARSKEPDGAWDAVMWSRCEPDAVRVAVCLDHVPLRMPVSVEVSR